MTYVAWLTNLKEALKKEMPPKKTILRVILRLFKAYTRLLVIFYF